MPQSICFSEMYFYSSVLNNNLCYRKGLDKMKQKLPLTSAEYPVGSSQSAEYKSFFLRLLALLRLTQDLQLLEFVASIATQEEEHICHEAIQTTLKAIMSR
jgi:hypothetical protein